MDSHYEFADARRSSYPELFRAGARIVDEVAVDYFRAVFEEASSVFDDDRAMVLPDPESDGFRLIIGESARGNVLVVRHAFDEVERRVTLGASRVANPEERSIYEARRSPT